MYSLRPICEGIPIPLTNSNSEFNTLNQHIFCCFNICLRMWHVVGQIWTAVRKKRTETTSIVKHLACNVKIITIHKHHPKWWGSNLRDFLVTPPHKLPRLSDTWLEFKNNTHKKYPYQNNDQKYHTLYTSFLLLTSIPFHLIKLSHWVRASVLFFLKQISLGPCPCWSRRLGSKRNDIGWEVIWQSTNARKDSPSWLKCLKGDKN